MDFADKDKQNERYQEVLGHGLLEISVLISNTNPENQQFYGSNDTCQGIDLYLAH